MPIVVPDPPAPPTAVSSLANLRQKVAGRLNVLVQGNVQATPKADATLSSFYDDAMSGEFENTFRNAWVLMTSGTATNVGQFRQVAGNKDGLFSFKRAWPVAPAAGDTYDLYRRFDPPDFRDAINWAIDNVFPWIYVGFRQELPETTNTMEYPYPSLSSPTQPAVAATGAGAGSYLYRVASRNQAGDAIPSPASVAVANANPPTVSNFNVVTWTAVSNTDTYLILRSTDGGVTWKLLTTVIGQASGTVMTLTDNGAYESGAAAYSLAVTSPQLVDLRQLWRRNNPGVQPPTYQEMRGSIWADLGKAVRVRWQPVSGQFLCFVGYARFAPLTADTDTVDSSKLPDELIIRGASKILYENLAAGDASSATIYFERQAANWTKLYEAKRAEYAMEQIGREQHPPESHVVRGWVSDLGPIKA